MERQRFRDVCRLCRWLVRRCVWHLRRCGVSMDHLLWLSHLGALRSILLGLTCVSFVGLKIGICVAGRCHPGVLPVDRVGFSLQVYLHAHEHQSVGRVWRPRRVLLRRWHPANRVRPGSGGLRAVPTPINIRQHNSLLVLIRIVDVLYAGTHSVSAHLTPTATRWGLAAPSRTGSRS